MKSIGMHPNMKIRLMVACSLLFDRGSSDMMDRFDGVAGRCHG